MSDNIPPFEIQMEIIEKVDDVKSLIQFRSVSKQWKSFIDSSHFIKPYGARHTHPHTHILSYCRSEDLRYSICLAEEDDDIETFKVQQLQEFVMSPLLKQQYGVSYVVGESHGLLCLCCPNNNNDKEEMLVIWNPSIRKSFGVAVPTYDHKIYFRLTFSFGVCPIASDHTIVMTLWTRKIMPCRVEIFTLSSGVWNSIPSANLPRQSVIFRRSDHVAIDRFIYWGAHERISHAHGKCTTNVLVVSFDMITTEFKVIDLPDSFKDILTVDVSLAKIRDSLVLQEVKEEPCCGVWVMEHDSSFRKLFDINIGASFRLLGCLKNGGLIFEFGGGVAALYVYDPYSQQIKCLWIPGLPTGLIPHGLSHGIATFA